MGPSTDGSSMAWAFLRRSIVLLLSVLVFVTAISAAPVSDQPRNNGTEVTYRHVDQLSSRAAGTFYLRIMPLGASIMRGSNDDPKLKGRGFRKYLRDRLRSRGWRVNMVGSHRNGEGFNDNDTEGWPGYVVGPTDGSSDSHGSVHEKAKSAVPRYKPNVVLLNVGTNDARNNLELDKIGERMEALLKTIFDGSPGVVVILSTLLPSWDFEERHQYINILYRRVVAKLRKEGRKILLAEMHDGFITGSELIDGIHPTDVGAIRMAAVWDTIIQEAEAKGDWLQEPNSDVAFKDDANGNTCDKDAGSGNADPRSGEQILFARSGNVRDDGTYVHSSREKGAVSIGFHTNLPSREQRWRMYAAQLVNSGGADRGGERDELINVHRDDDNIRIWVNDGNLSPENPPPYPYPTEIEVRTDCWSRGITWGDVNNDGLDDFICIRPNGEIRVSINEGGNPPQFKFVGTWRDAVDGYLQDKVRLGDIDGDGRLDYCVISAEGELRCWRNGGIQRERAEYWEDLGVMWTAEGKNLGNVDIQNFRLVDINGDFRADALWVDGTGRTTTWINQRNEGDGLAPYWREAGVTHPGRGVDIGDRENIIFGRMFNDRHTDYLHWENGEEELTSIRAWESLGEGGTFQKGDGVNFADMTGSGIDDYVFIYKDGSVVIFVNGNEPPDTSKYRDGAAWTDKGIVLRTEKSLQSLHLGDWDGDGKADIISVDKKTGRLDIWITSYEDGNFSFRQSFKDESLCTQGWGVGRYDIGARFADITGSGCVDYLCLEPDGRTTAWLNDCKQGELRFVGQVKVAIGGKDRANIRFADVNGDGRADYMWVNKFNGNTDVWINDGERPESERESLLGSKVNWTAKGQLYNGFSRGPNMHFANIGGVGRADMVKVDPITAHAWVSYNSCPAGGDENGVIPKDPALPFYGPMPQCSWPTCYETIERDDDSWGCDMDPFADDFADDEFCDVIGGRGDDESISSLSAFHEGGADGILEWNGSSSLASLEERAVWLERRMGKPREFLLDINALAVILHLIWRARRYPGSTHLHDSTQGPPASNDAFRMANTCGSDIEVVDARTLTIFDRLGSWDTEHNPDLQFTRDFLTTVTTGVLPNGTRTVTPAIPAADLEANWNANVLPPNLPRAGTSRCLRSPSQYFGDPYGSHGNRAPMVLCNRSLNQVKGRVFHLRMSEGPNEPPVRPVSDETFEALLDEALVTTAGQDALFSSLWEVVGVWTYINHPNALPIVRRNVNALGSAATNIAVTVHPLRNLGALFHEFYPAWYQEAADLSRIWLADRIVDVRARFEAAIASGAAPPGAQNVLAQLNRLFDALSLMRSPF